MNLNNTFLASVLAVLGLFLAFVSLKLNGVIESNIDCVKRQSLVNSNRIVLIIGIVLFMSSGGYLLCKRSCSGELSVPSQTSDMMYLTFNLVLGIMIIVLFSIISNNLTNCKAPLSMFDSLLVKLGLVVGVLSTVLSLSVLGKKLYDNRGGASQKLSEMKVNAMAKAQSLKGDASQKLSEMKVNAMAKAQSLKNDGMAKAQSLKNDAMAKAQSLKNSSSPSRKEFDFNADELAELPSDYKYGINLGYVENGPYHMEDNSPDRIPYMDPFGYDD
jgi:hypothetical protein